MGLDIFLDIFEKKDVEFVVMADEGKAFKPIFINGIITIVELPIKYIRHPGATHYARRIAHLRKNEPGLLALKKATGAWGPGDYFIFDEGSLEELIRQLQFLDDLAQSKIEIKTELTEFREKLELLFSKLDHKTQYAAFSWVT